MNLIGGLGGLATGSKLSNITKEELKAIKNKISKNEKLDIEQAKQLQEAVKDGGKVLEQKIYDELRSEVTNNLEEQIYKTQSILASNTKSVNNMNSENISKIEKAFNNVTNSRNNEILDEILNGVENVNIDKTNISSLLTKSKKTEKEINKFTDSFSSSTGNLTEGELKSAIKEEALTKARKNIKNKVEEAGVQYEKALADVKDQKIKVGAIDVKKDMNDKLLNETDTKTLNHYGEKLNQAEKVEDLIKIQREINEDLYRADDSTKYLLNDIKSKINDYYSTEAKEGNEAFKKILEANEQYSKDKAIIDADREILDTLHGGRDKFRKAENRTLEESSTAYDNYNKLSPEQQQRLLELTENNEVFRNINRTKIDNKKFDTYSDLELKNAFGDRSEEAIKLAHAYGAELPTNELVQQITNAFVNAPKSKQMLADDYKKIINDISSQIKDSEKAKQLNKFAETLVKEKQTFQQAKLFADLKTGNTEILANKIKTIDDIDNLYKIRDILTDKNGLSNTDIKTLHQYIDDTVNIKKQEFVDGLTSISEKYKATGEQELGSYIKDITSFLESRGALAEKLYNNQNITQNLKTLQTELNKIPQQLQELSEKAKQLKESNPIFQKLKTILSKNQSAQAEQSWGSVAVSNILLGLITGHSFIALGKAFAEKVIPQIMKSISNKKLNKLSEDPKYFAKQFKIFKQEARNISNLTNNVHTDLMKNISKYYGNLINSTIAPEQ